MTAIATLPVLLGVGDHASRPAASAVGSGGLYSCTTHSLVYQTDGSSWTTWATLGGGTPDLDAVIAVSGGQDISDALSGAAAPDAGNVFATMADVGGASGLVLLEQHAASSSATLDFTSTISSTYDEYIFEFLAILPATNGAMFEIRVGTGGGPTYDTGSNYSYSNWWKKIGDTAAMAAWGTTTTALSFFNDSAGSGILSTAAPGAAGTIHLYDPENTSNAKLFTWEQLQRYSGDSNYYRVTGGGVYTQTTALTAIRFLMSTGNIASGTVRAYGVAK